ncbi:unnamed protein product [Rotaria sordida]|uniref:Uncharacterized protein n=1 Tax=Rotaria sordida TaxID=392033 RepID=A0A819JC05_9BILA|nr:unnamed protein product [Rotaria sordida]
MKQESDERQVLLDDEKTSHNIHDQNRHAPSRLEWAESSWFRLFHILFWSWLKPILLSGYKRQLIENDLDDLPLIDKTLILLERLESYDWSSTTSWMIIRKEFMKDLISVCLMGSFFCMADITQVLIFCQLIWSITNKQTSTYRLYLYIILLLLSIVLQSMVERQAVFRSSRVGIRIRNALNIFIYIRALSLKSTSSEKINTGQILNLITSDTFKFEELCTNLAGLTASILETIILFGVLCWIIHPIPILCGYAIYPIFILIQMYFGRKFRQCREITAVCSDKRIQAYSEFIYGCHTVKMYNWEKPMENHIIQMRKNELESIRYTSRFRAFNRTQHFISIQLLSLATFGSAWLLGYPLTIANTFPVIMAFAFMRENIAACGPLAFEKFNEAKLASKRIDVFMHLTVKQEHQSSSNTLSSDQKQKGSIIMSNASFSWQNDISCLSSLNLLVENGTLVGIVGPVGCGKSSFLAAVLGEMNLIEGQLNTHHSSFSYTAQPPWIFADTFRNNILLNRPYNEQRYRDVIDACCLDVDLSRLGSRGDLTMIGDNGINLSGGQKARVGLARALYADADIYLLDDPLSAVDRTVAKHIYERCIGSNGLLRNKTRLLVTHQTQFLFEADQIIFLSHGQIDKEDRLDENFARQNEPDKKQTSVLTTMLEDNSSVSDEQSIVTDEISVNDRSNWSLYYDLFAASPSGIYGFCLLIVLLLLSEIFNDGANYWLNIWLKQSKIDRQLSPKYAYIYFGLIIGTLVMDILRTNYYFKIILNGSNSLHNSMLKGLIYTSLEFFESNPSGRILNRASKDQYVIDELLPALLLNGIEVQLIAVGAMFIVCFLNPSIIFVLPIFFVGLWFMMHFYQRSFRQLKRLENMTRSPVYALFSTSLSGLSTIRAFKAEKSFIQLISKKMDVNTSAYLIVQAATQCFAFMLTILGSFILLVTSIRIVFLSNQIDSPDTALSLISTIFIASCFQWSLRKFVEADTLMTSAQRIDEYGHLPREENENDCKRLVKTSPDWPNEGRIEFRNYSLRYRANLPYTLRNIDLHIESGQKIGIIGRTGAGKSSLFKGLFRFVDQSNVNGDILIDDVNIHRLRLNHLRSNLTVVPQQSILFSGSLRYNLDPFDSYSDEQCWKVLEDVQLKQFVQNHSTGLQMSISEWGHNLSVGQCQLINFARAILKNTKILLIDEATAYVDQKTDNLIQTLIENKFHDRTILIIAHRLNTVAKCDHILVLDNGMVVNYDTSTNILNSY